MRVRLGVEETPSKYIHSESSIAKARAMLDPYPTMYVSWTVDEGWTPKT